MQNFIKKEISSLNLMFISIAAIFGSGWLFTPLYAAQTAGPQAILSWIIGAVMSAVIGITMAEVITLFPKSGGINTIIEITHGKLISFLANTLTLIVCIILPALEVRAILQYLGSHNAHLMTLDHHVTLIGYSIAGVLLFIINWINIKGVRLFSRINTLSVFFKLIAPVTICICFLIVLKKSGTLTFSNFHQVGPIKWDQVFLAISTSGIIFSFNGFNQATFFAAEAKKPQKTIPFAIFGSLLFTSILYIFIQSVFLVAVPKSSIVNGWNLLTFTGDNGPFAGLAVLLGLHGLLYFIYADAIISPLGTAFNYSGSAFRMLYAFSKNSALFPVLHKLNKDGIPTYSVISSMLLGFLAFLFLPSLKSMISILVAAFVLNYTLAPISLLALRTHYPETSRSFRIPYASFFCFLSLFFSCVMVWCCGFDSLRNLLIAIGLAFSIGCLLLIRSKSDAYAAIKGSFWFIIQAVFLTLISYLSQCHLLSFFQALTLISLFCLVLPRLDLLVRKEIPTFNQLSVNTSNS